MGPTPSGPAFRAWTPPPPAPFPPPTPRKGRIGGPRSRLPDVVSIGAIALVAIVVVAATLVARYADTHIAAPVPPTIPVRTVPQNDNRIDFMTSKGSGQLIMLSREWVTDGPEPPTTGSYLRIEVELVCTDGRVDYDPYNFQVFDRGGELYELSVEGAGSLLLDVGTLRSGERVRGTVAFDMPRGEATLLMSDEADQTVTALRVPD